VDVVWEKWLWIISPVCWVCRITTLVGEVGEEF